LQCVTAVTVGGFSGNENLPVAPEQKGYIFRKPLKIKDFIKLARHLLYVLVQEQ
jgi:hypothetical protein